MMPWHIFHHIQKNLTAVIRIYRQTDKIPFKHEGLVKRQLQTDWLSRRHSQGLPYQHTRTLKLVTLSPKTRSLHSKDLSPISEVRIHWICEIDFKEVPMQGALEPSATTYGHHHNSYKRPIHEPEPLGLGEDRTTWLRFWNQGWIHHQNGTFKTDLGFSPLHRNGCCPGRNKKIKNHTAITDKADEDRGRTRT